MKAMEFEVPVSQPAALVWQTHIKNCQISMPAAVPGHFKAVEFLEGPPLAAGGVFKICYDEGFGHYDNVKFVWDEMDHENFCCKLTGVDGGALGRHFHGFTYHYKILPGADEKSCIMSWKIEYHDLNEHNFHDVLKDELIKLSQCLDAYITTSKQS